MRSQGARGGRRSVRLVQFALVWSTRLLLPVGFGFTRRRTKVHGQLTPSARPLIASRVTVASPLYDLVGAVADATAKNGPVSRQRNTSPLTTRPSIDAKGALSSPWASPLTFAPVC